MQTGNFDLNLFKVLVALYEERSVSRAAVRLGRTQSAVSNSLRKLREFMNDPLFIRSPDGLALTPKARKLEEHARAVIHLTEAALSGSEEFDPANASGEFRIGAPDRLGLPVILPLFQSLHALTPTRRFI